MSCSDGLRRFRIGGLPILATTRDDFANRFLADAARQKEHGRTLPAKISYSANGQIIAEVNADPAMAELFNASDYIDADGMPLVIASRLFYSPGLQERIATTDFFHDLATAAQKHGLSFYILGSTPDHHARAIRAIRDAYPDLKIAGHHHGYFTAEEETAIVQSIQASAPDLLWIAMGYPRQERFAARHKQAWTGIAWVKTCGGLLEHLLGLHPRAPLWMQKMSLEWFYRLIREPRRLFWRYTKTNPCAIWYLLTRSGDKGCCP